MKGKAILNDERGSATIEFLSMVPLVLLMMLIFWQFLVAGYAVIVTQSAANEAAKVYSVTKDSAEAENAARKVINNAGNNLSLRSAAPSGNKKFTITVNVDMHLLFLPKKWAGYLPPINFSRTISGRVME